MSMSLTLLLKEVIDVYREHVGFLKATRQEITLAKKKIDFQPFVLEAFDQSYLEGSMPNAISGFISYSKSDGNRHDDESLGVTQRQAVNLLGKIAVEMGYQITLGDLQGTPVSSGQIFIPLYLSDGNNPYDPMMSDTWDAIREEIFPEFDNVAGVSNSAMSEQGLLPPPEEKFSFDDLFSDAFSRDDKNIIKVKTKRVGHA